MVTAIAAVAALAVIAAGCGSSSKNGSGTGTNTGTPTTHGLVGGSDTGPGVRGGSLVYGIEADTSGGWCLAEAQLAIGGIQVARAIYDTLTAPGADGKIHPYLASSVTANPAATLWTITLRPNVKFSDGTPLNAQVVKDNLDAYRGALKVRSPLLFTFVFSDIASVTVTGPLTVTVATKRPWQAFPWFLWSSGRIGIMGEAQVKNPKNCNTDLIGTGPFQKVSWTFGDKFVAKRNPNYWQKDSKGVQLPYLDQITFVPQEDSSKRVSALEAGDFNIIENDDPLQIVAVRKEVAKGTLATTESDKFTELGYTQLNATQAPFNNLAARQTVAYAFDRNTFNKIRNDDILTNATGPFALGVVGNLADSGFPNFDPAKAKAAAAQYKQETGKTLTFTLSHSSDPSTTQDAVLIQQMLKRNAGIDVKLNPVPDQSTLINLAIGRKFDAMLWRNNPGADDDTQTVWWHCNNSPAVGTNPNGDAPCDNPVNFGGFNDPIINTDLDKARVEPNQATRASLYEDINREFAKELWNIWGQYVLWTIEYKPDVHGVLGPNLPDGTAPFTGLPTGHPVLGLWCTGGKC